MPGAEGALTADDLPRPGRRTRCGFGFPTGRYLPIPGAEGAVVAEDLPEGRGAELVRGSDFGLGRFPALPGAEGR